MQDIHYIGTLEKNKILLEKEYGILKTFEVVLTNERIKHIKNGHEIDYELFVKYAKNVIETPDLILDDNKNKNTIFMIKHINEINLNVVIKLAISDDEKHPKNSIMTAYRIRNKNVNKLERKHKMLYKQE